MDDDLQRLIFEVIDGTISAEDFERLQNAIEQDEAVRAEYLRAVGLCESLSEIAGEPLLDAVEADVAVSPDAAVSAFPKRRIRITTARQLVVAATLVAAVGVSAFWLGRVGRPTSNFVAAVEEESRIAGHATLRRAVGMQWPDDSVRRFEGDLLPGGRFAFDAGVAEIDFFCGATLIAEGPAVLEIESDWVVRLIKGRLRANVPPAARGFVVKAAESEIVDLGTEFAVDVSSASARVEVIDGEVELSGGPHDGKHLFTGEAASLKGTASTAQPIARVPTVAELDQQRQGANSRSLSEWLSTSEQLREDDRLIAYFPIANSLRGRIVPNAAVTGQEFSGLLVGPVKATIGRFGPKSAGLEFDRPGSRVRTRIDGEYSAFTFACWVRIDSLPHRYNALFMADSYENGEPHWQIRDDGRMMFSVMVDDSQEIEHFSELDQKMVKQAGLHRVYYTDPIWDASKSGQWFHLAAVYDPSRRRVAQYVNGALVASEEISDKFFTDKLHIGPAEIGNWGQPFRKTPWFSVRNLNGTIDELAIFDAPLMTTEISSLYEMGKPVGY